MHVEQPNPWTLIIKANMLPTWIKGVLYSAAIVSGCIYASIAEKLTINQETLIIFLPFLFLIGWPLSAFRFPTITTTFDKSLNNFMLEKQWIWTHRTVQYPFIEIKDIHVIRKGWFGKARRYYKIKVELSSGELIPMSALNYGNKAYEEKQKK